MKRFISILSLAPTMVVGLITLSVATEGPVYAEGSRRVLVAQNLSQEVGGCESKATHFTVNAPSQVDDSKGGQGGAPAGFDFEIQGNNRHGVINARRTNDRGIELDVYAEGKGAKQNIPLVGEKCIGAEGANAAVNVYAWVK